MSENKAPKEAKEAKPKDAKPKEAKAKDAKPKGGEVKSGRQEMIETKPAWTMERCRNRARRFDTENQWMLGHPSSYKSAAYHGWVAECVAAMGKKAAPSRKAA